MYSKFALHAPILNLTCLNLGTHCSTPAFNRLKPKFVTHLTATHWIKILKMKKIKIKFMSYKINQT